MDAAPRIEMILPIIRPIIVNLFNIKKLDYKTIKD
tara:strand:+ start:528 stop:632 length:105 start_codon:yes stop_codon:yes gene_type:complete